MKVRFSIRTLMLLTVFVAIVFAGVRVQGIYSNYLLRCRIEGIIEELVDDAIERANAEPSPASFAKAELLSLQHQIEISSDVSESFKKRMKERIDPQMSFLDELVEKESAEREVLLWVE